MGIATSIKLELTLM